MNEYDEDGFDQGLGWPSGNKAGGVPPGRAGTPPSPSIGEPILLGPVGLVGFPEALAEQVQLAFDAQYQVGRPPESPGPKDGTERGRLTLHGVSGSGQSGVIGRCVQKPDGSPGDPLIVQVREGGKAASGVPVLFEPDDPSGFLAEAPGYTTVSDGDGKAAVRYVLGRRRGAQKVKATLLGDRSVAPVEFVEYGVEPRLEIMEQNSWSASAGVKVPPGVPAPPRMPVLAGTGEWALFLRLTGPAKSGPLPVGHSPVRLRLTRDGVAARPEEDVVVSPEWGQTNETGRFMAGIVPLKPGDWRLEVSFPEFPELGTRRYEARVEETAGRFMPWGVRNRKVVKRNGIVGAMGHPAELTVDTSELSAAATLLAATAGRMGMEMVGWRILAIATRGTNPIGGATNCLLSAEGKKPAPQLSQVVAPGARFRFNVHPETPTPVWVSVNTHPVLVKKGAKTPVEGEKSGSEKPPGSPGAAPTISTGGPGGAMPAGAGGTTAAPSAPPPVDAGATPFGSAAAAGGHEAELPKTAHFELSMVAAPEVRLVELDSAGGVHGARAIVPLDPRNLESGGSEYAVEARLPVDEPLTTKGGTVSTDACGKAGVAVPGAFGPTANVKLALTRVRTGSRMAEYRTTTPIAYITRTLSPGQTPSTLPGGRTYLQAEPLGRVRPIAFAQEPVTGREIDVADVRIYHGSRDVTDKSVTVLPGEVVQLKALVRKPDVAARWQWDVQGNYLKKWHGGMDKSERVELGPEDFTKDTIRFFWWKPAQSLEVKLTMHVEDRHVSVAARFDVARPEATLRAESHSPVKLTRDLDEDPGPLFIAYGGDVQVGASIMTGRKNAVPGVSFTGSVTLPRTRRAKWAYLQVARLHREITTKKGAHLVRSSGSEWELDGSWPYRTVGDRARPSIPFLTEDGEATEGDWPAQRLAPSARDPVRVVIGTAMGFEEFETFLMFRPAGDESMFVPLLKVGWGWRGQADLEGSDWLLRGGESRIGAPHSVEAYPAWTSNAARRALVEVR